ncbi:unnamed protein product [Effrenium voratum]|nr:unnamed protein product [Effrenium voratum]
MGAAGSFCDSKSIVEALEASGPCAGARKTSVLREGQPQSQEQAKLASLATAVSAATDLATYWSNSVRAYALSRSPFLRPPVFSALWRLHIDFLPGTSGSVSALLRAAHARRVLEIQLSGETVRGVAWCVATTPTPEQGFPKVVVPPVPIADAEEASRRFKALQNRPRPAAVKEGERTGEAAVAPLTLTLESEDATADRLADLSGRRIIKTSLDACQDPKACGDVGPVLSSAVRLAAALAAAPLAALRTVEAEASPLAPGCAVELRARRDGDGVLVTGWVGGKDVLRLKALFAPEE